MRLHGKIETPRLVPHVQRLQGKRASASVQRLWGTFSATETTPCRMTGETLRSHSTCLGLYPRQVPSGHASFLEVGHERGARLVPHVQRLLSASISLVNFEIRP